MQPGQQYFRPQWSLNQWIVPRFQQRPLGDVKVSCAAMFCNLKGCVSDAKSFDITLECVDMLLNKT